MSIIGKTALCLLATITLSSGVRAITPDPAGSANPYTGIVERNVFALKPPTPPPAPDKPVDNTPPPPKIFLTGITTILGNRMALMKATLPAKPPEAGKPPEAPKETSIMLYEGQRDGQIEVVAIDAAAKTVKVNNYGTEMMLSFDKDGVKSTAPAAGAPVNPGGIPVPGQFKGAFPSRTLRVPTGPNTNPFSNPGSNAGQSPGANYNPNGAVNNGVNPSASINGLPLSGGTSQLQVAEPETQISPEEQMIIMEAHNQKNRDNPNFPKFPPTVLTSPEDRAALVNPNQTPGAPPAPGQPQHNLPRSAYPGGPSFPQ